MVTSRIRILGIAVLLSGLFAIFTWLFRPDLATEIGRGAGYLVFNTALCMVLAGAALNLLHSASRPMVMAQNILGCAIFVVAGISLAEHVFDINTGIDWAQLHRAVTKNSTPGRMSLMSSVSFMIIGLVIVLMHNIRRTFYGRLIQGLVLGAIALGITGIISLFLQFEVIFGRDALTFMSLSNSIAVLLIGLGLWLHHRDTAWAPLLPELSPDQNILLNGAVILGLTAVITAFVSFVSHQKALEKALGDGLQQALHSRVTLISHEISRLEQDAETMATRPVFLDLVRTLNARPQDPAAQGLLERGVQSFLKTGFTGIAFLDARGNTIMTTGSFAEKSDMAVQLQSAHQSRLLWNGQYHLNTRVAMTDSNGAIGTLITEQPATIITESLENPEGMRRTGETGMCAPIGTENRMACFPLRFKPDAFTPPRVIDGEPLPMDYALRGLTGTVKSRDYRRQIVIAAYAPVGRNGLGLVAKMDAAELYEPIRDQLQIMSVLIFFMLIAGTLLLRLQIRPLARRLFTSEQQLRLALDSSQLALYDWDVRSDTVYLSEQWQRLLGGTDQPTNTTSRALAALVHPDDLAELRRQLALVLKGGITNYDYEHRVKNMQGDWIWIRSRGEVVERDSRGNALRVTGTNTDISERKNAELKLAHQATHDALTGLPNRVLFQDRLSQAMTQSLRNKSLMAVFYLDIDKFKSINDNLGHATGDALLKAFSQRLLNCVRAVDTVARLGGDEFAVILSSVDIHDNACKVAEKIVQAMRPEFVIENRGLSTTTSVGVAFYAGDSGVTAGTLIKKADQALYEAKGAGRNNYKVIDEPQKSAAAPAPE